MCRKCHLRASGEGAVLVAGEGGSLFSNDRIISYGSFDSSLSLSLSHLHSLPIPHLAASRANDAASSNVASGDGENISARRAGGSEAVHGPCAIQPLSSPLPLDAGGSLKSHLPFSVAAKWYYNSSRGSVT